MDHVSDSTTHDKKKCEENKKKMYKGVRKRKWGKWVSEIRLPNSRERIWLGSHDSAEKAARAFDAALYCLRGRHANFNFPDTPFNLVNNVNNYNNSLTPQQIQQIASNFANNINQPPTNVVDNNNHNNAASSSSNTSTIDWTFLNALDASTEDANFIHNYGDLEKMHSGELLYSIPPPFFEDDNNRNQIEANIDAGDYDDPFSHPSFLWNWNF